MVVRVDDVAVPMPIAAQLFEGRPASSVDLRKRTGSSPLTASRLLAMRALAQKLPVLAAVCAAFLVLAAPALAAPHFDGSFKVGGTGANNLKMALGSDGNVWMTTEGMGGQDVARITPAGVVTEFEFEGAVKKPIGIASGPEGALWVTTEEGVATFTTAAPTKATETAIPGIKETARSSPVPITKCGWRRRRTWSTSNRRAPAPPEKSPLPD